MKIIHQLSSQKGSRIQEDNIELAHQIVKKKDKNAIKELMELLQHFDKKIRHDSIKVLYEVGEAQPKMIADFIQHFFHLLESKDNRMQWGAMTALSAIAFEKSEDMYHKVPKLIEIAEAGSVITNDHLIKILTAIGLSQPHYKEDMYALLIEQTLKSPENQMPKYAEETARLSTPENKHLLIEMIQQRLPEMKTESKVKRLEKLLKKLS